MNNNIISPQIIGSAQNKEIHRKITVLSFYLDDSDTVIENETHKLILQLFVDGNSTRQIGHLLRTQYFPEVQPVPRKNAVKSFGHEGISRIVNRYFNQAVEHYKGKYETTQAASQ